MITINVDGVVSVAVAPSLFKQLLTRNIRYFRMELASSEWSDDDIKHINSKIAMYEEMIEEVEKIYLEKNEPISKLAK